jgi:hypothetical protein
MVDHGGASGGGPAERRAEDMFANKTRVLLVLPQDLLDRARVMAGKTTTTLKLPVSVQIVLRALIEQGLKRGNDRSLLANIEGQAHAVRRIRSLARQGESVDGKRGDPRLGNSRGSSGREGQRRGKSGAVSIPPG